MGLPEHFQAGDADQRAQHGTENPGIGDQAEEFIEGGQGGTFRDKAAHQPRAHHAMGEVGNIKNQDHPRVGMIVMQEIKREIGRQDAEGEPEPFAGGAQEQTGNKPAGGQPEADDGGAGCG